ncbi:hypothetical protein EMIT0347P_20252 [Pseudomonas sp. IT-347P]
MVREQSKATLRWVLDKSPEGPGLHGHSTLMNQKHNGRSSKKHRYLSDLTGAHLRPARLNDSAPFISLSEFLPCRHPNPMQSYPLSFRSKEPAAQKLRRAVQPTRPA